MMTRFLITNLFYAPDIHNDKVLEFIYREADRDFPWIWEEKHDVYLSGIGQGWSGLKKREHMTSHAGFRSTPFNALNAILAWFTHFIDALKLSRKGTVVVLAPTPESGFGAALAKALAKKRIHLVVRVQGHTASKALHVKRSKFRFKVLEVIETFVLQHADLVIPMGKFTYDLAISKGINPERVIILPFPVRWADLAEIAEFPERPCLLFVGRLEKEKGVHVLLHAMVSVKQQIPCAHLLIAGDGSFRSELERIVESLKLQDAVSFLGWLEPSQVRDIYKNAWVLTLPSIWEEGLGMVLVEAGLMGRPVVASNIGGIRDVVRHGENGFLVPPGDATALAEALVTVLKDQALAQQMGLAGVKIAREYLRGREEAIEQVRQAIYRLLGD